MNDREISLSIIKKFFRLMFLTQVELIFYYSILNSQKNKKFNNIFLEIGNIELFSKNENI